MKLLTKEVAKRFPGLGTFRETPIHQIPAVAKFFLPEGRATWYAFEADAILDDRRQVPLRLCTVPFEQLKDVLFFGYVELLSEDCDEPGNFSLRELESIRGRFLGLPVERDILWTPAPVPALAKRHRPNVICEVYAPLVLCVDCKKKEAAKGTNMRCEICALADALKGDIT